MNVKIGILMDLPDGKLPGFYAQIIKALANKAPLFDRDKEMLIVSSDNEQQTILGVMDQYKVETDIMQLLLLPDEAELTPLWSDYGFSSKSENHYLYAKLVSAFRFNSAPSSSEQDQAVLQMEEHLLARYPVGAEMIYLVDKQLEELMLGIAKAYRCEIELVVL
jgi:hypothetical protein